MVVTHQLCVAGSIQYRQGQPSTSNNSDQGSQTLVDIQTSPAQELLSQEIWEIGTTPIKLPELARYLTDYPFQDDKSCIYNGFKHGFRLNYHGPRVPVFSNNLKSAYQYPKELQFLLDQEIEKGRILGPFAQPPISNLHISPIGLVPKKTGGWRLITHLSHPLGLSINEYIDPASASVNYTSFDKTLDMIISLGVGALMGKKDIKSAFRLLPIYPGDFCLLGMHHLGHYYIDKCLPMGCSTSCNLFEKFSTFIEWATAKKVDLHTLDHYLDDFIFGGQRDTSECLELMNAFDVVCYELGVPVAPEKTEGPSYQD